ncbi:MAG: Uma2 family endonuclease [Methylacidiphilales bacterium]|nr:Uma2 family endonuclease [Candidatus Methylacidiphilales bacterium]NJR16136.1 Uma2 family endonuclease [Calothrix sp. CSU_2_0]
MVQERYKMNLPTSAELACSDDIPVDNEEQNYLPNFLLFLLEFIWASRNDWFFGVDMGVYHTTGANARVPVVPDAFLSLGVPRRRNNTSRASYLVWEEEDVVPIFTLEVVSQTYGGEYDTKMKIYAQLGVLYYLVYNPNFWKRDQHQPFEMYRLVDGEYQQQIGEPFWMPEICLGIGRNITQSGGLQREVLYWYNEANVRYQTPEELLESYKNHFGNL